MLARLRPWASWPDSHPGTHAGAGGDAGFADGLHPALRQAHLWLDQIAEARKQQP